MNAEEIKDLSFEMIHDIEQAAEQRTREAIRDGLLAYRNKKGPVNWMPVPDAIEIAMTTEIK